MEGSTTTIMRTIGFLLLAAIVAGTLSCAKPATKSSTNEKQSDAPYTYENDLFSVTIPNGWGVDPSEWEGLNGFKNEVEIVDFNFGDPLDGIVSLHFVKTLLPFDGRNVIEAAEMAKTARALSTDSVELIWRNRQCGSGRLSCKHTVLCLLREWRHPYPKAVCHLSSRLTHCSLL